MTILNRQLILMPQVFKKAITLIMTSLLIIVTCTACQKSVDKYLLKDFFDDLVLKTGIVKNDDESSFEVLSNWGVLHRTKYALDEQFDYELLSEVIFDFMEETYLDSYKEIKERQWIDDDVKRNDIVDQTSALAIIDELAYQINNPIVENQNNVVSFFESLKDELVDVEKYSYDTIFYSVEDNCFYDLNPDGSLNELIEDELFEYIKIDNELELDFDNTEIIFEGSPTSTIKNHDFNLLSTSSHNSFELAGFNVSYSIRNDRIVFSVYKDYKGMKIYDELVLSNIRPEFKWNYKNGTINHAYVKLNLNLSNKLGVKKDKRAKYNVDFDNLSPDDIFDKLKTILKGSSYNESIVIPLAKIKIPVKEIPFIYLNAEISLLLKASGKVELVLNDSYITGFEIKNNHMRLIFDKNHDLSAIVNGNATISANALFNIVLVDYSIADLGVETGIKAMAQATVHSYDDQGQIVSQKMSEEYSDIDEISANSSNILLCGDLSLHWLLNVNLNSSRSLLGRLGFKSSHSLLNEDNQIFNNFSHIENGHFTQKCTRSNRQKISSIDSIDSNKILLESYSLIITNGSEKEIPIIQIPSDYQIEDLIITVSNQDVIKLNGLSIHALKLGSSIIKISTKDNKYQASLNVLVSDE